MPNGPSCEKSRPKKGIKKEERTNSSILQLRQRSRCLVKWRALLFLVVEQHRSVNLPITMVLLQPDPFLNELTSMFERSTEKGSVWVTLKRSSLKSKVQRNKQTTDGEAIDYRCLIRATDGKKTISTSAGCKFGKLVISYRDDSETKLGTFMVGAKDHVRFQASYATILKAHMTALKKRERKEKKKAAETDKKEGAAAKKPKKA
ncbi:hypothetical protein TIFTF001_010292 [Ficus carica]|uniref:Signal recognition particle 14 kDa protein n=1 Tax=Ficus carica TaxID=3494 RepID=A0AA87ZW80_FICCA|nr:hypothetical protein TIFTF001_010292 [Ficus carica]